MKAETKRSKSAKARRNFKSWNETGYPEVINKKTGEAFHKSKGEVFLSSPTLGRKFGENRYYISNKGHLISFAKNPDRPELINVDRFKAKKGKKGKYYRDKYTIGNNFHEYTYRLVAEAFGVYAYGLATKKDKVHHTRRYIQAKGLYFNNNPDYLEYVTEEVHKLLNRLQESQDRERTLEEEISIMQAISYIAGKEEPNKISVFWDNPDKTKAETTKTVTFRGQAAEFMMELNNYLYRMAHPEEPEIRTDKPDDKLNQP